MKTLIVGASGATGRLLVEQLLNKGKNVKIIVRSSNMFSSDVLLHDNLSVIHASILDLSDDEMIDYVRDCEAVASCLGHNLSFKGIYGHPRRLVTDAARRLCNAIRKNNPKTPVKFVLMNTTGDSNRDLSEKVSVAQQCVIWLLRLLLPPHADNENAADYLRAEVGQNDREIEWVAVRPDALIDEIEVSGYELHPSPVRSAIFDAGKVSRINVGNFMAGLITDDELWRKWKGKMPVIYSKV